MKPSTHSTDNIAHTDADEALVQQARAGDLAAFEELVNRHEQRVYTLARRVTGNIEDAEDVTQQTFISALRHLDGFRGDARFLTWLMKIATYAALRVIRKRRGLPMESLDAATDPDEDGSVPHPDYIADWRSVPDLLAGREETRQLIDQALASLDEKYRMVFLLRDVEGLSVRETAEALRVSEANIKVRLLRARLQLREHLTRAFGDESTRVHRDHAHH